MGYKRIRSAMHNFNHSFVSSMNHVDGEYIIDILPVVLRELPGARLTIQFPDDTLEAPAHDYPRRLRESVGYWSARFPDHHLRREGVEPSSIAQAQLVLSLGAGLQCEARATDDTGKVHAVAVGSAKEAAPADRLRRPLSADPLGRAGRGMGLAARACRRAEARMNELRGFSFDDLSQIEYLANTRWREAGVETRVESLDSDTIRVAVLAFASHRLLPMYFLERDGFRCTREGAQLSLTREDHYSLD